jgi:hypothetical protein
MSSIEPSLSLLTVGTCPARICFTGDSAGAAEIEDGGGFFLVFGTALARAAAEVVEERVEWSSIRAAQHRSILQCSFYNHLQMDLPHTTRASVNGHRAIAA